MPKTETTRYFAYATVLDPTSRAAWLHEQGAADWSLGKGRVAAARDVDLIYNAPASSWGGRVVGLNKKPGAKVYGVLFEVRDGDWAAIRAAEAVKGCKQQEMPVTVEVGGKSEKAVAFVPAAELVSLEGDVSERYARALAEAAEKAGLPREYVTRLQADVMILERVQRVGRENDAK